MTKITILGPGPVEILTAPGYRKRFTSKEVSKEDHLKAIRQSDLIIVLAPHGIMKDQIAKDMYYARERGKRMIVVEKGRVWEMKGK